MIKLRWWSSNREQAHRTACLWKERPHKSRQNCTSRTCAVPIMYYHHHDTGQINISLLTNWNVKRSKKGNWYLPLLERCFHISTEGIMMAICCPQGRGTLRQNSYYEVTMWCQVVSKLSKRSSKNVSKLSQSSPKQVDSTFCQSWVKIVSKLS